MAPEELTVTAAISHNTSKWVSFSFFFFFFDRKQQYVQRQEKLTFKDPTKLPNTNARQFPCESRWHAVGRDKAWKKKALCLVYSQTILLLSCQFLLLIFAYGSKINFSLAATQVNPSTTSLYIANNTSTQCSHQQVAFRNTSGITDYPPRLPFQGNAIRSLTETSWVAEEPNYAAATPGRCCPNSWTEPQPCRAKRHGDQK